MSNKDIEFMTRLQLKEEIVSLRARLLTAAGDDLCRLTPEEIKKYTSGEVQIPPKEVFIPSCEQFWEQTAARTGVLPNCFTVAQLIAENQRLSNQVRELEEMIDEASDSVLEKD